MEKMEKMEKRRRKQTKMISVRRPSSHVTNLGKKNTSAFPRLH